MASIWDNISKGVSSVVKSLTSRSSYQPVQLSQKTYNTMKNVGAQNIYKQITGRSYTPLVKTAQGGYTTSPSVVKKSIAQQGTNWATPVQLTQKTLETMKQPVAQSIYQRITGQQYNPAASFQYNPAKYITPSGGQMNNRGIAAQYQTNQPYIQNYQKQKAQYAPSAGGQVQMPYQVQEAGMIPSFGQVSDSWNKIFGQPSGKEDINAPAQLSAKAYMTMEQPGAQDIYKRITGQEYKKPEIKSDNLGKFSFKNPVGGYETLSDWTSLDETSAQRLAGTIGTQKLWMEGDTNNIPAPYRGMVANSLDDANLIEYINKMGTDGSAKDADIPMSRLDAIQDSGVMASAWDAGFESDKMLSSIKDYITKTANGHNVYVELDEDTLKKLTSDSINELITQMDSTSDAEWNLIASKGMTLVIQAGKVIATDLKGNSRISGSWDSITAPKIAQVTKEETQKEQKTDAQLRQEKYDEYWSDEEVNQRQAQWEEYYQWQQSKDLEGWSDYYKLLNNLKMSPEMNDYYSQTAVFNELKRKWQTSGSKLAWSQWLAQFNFNEDWGSKRPSDRGERPGVYNPRLKEVTYY